MGLLKELTIIIPVSNKKTFLVRNMNFWSQYEATLFVLDGGKCKIDDSIISKVGDNIRYYYLPISLNDQLLTIGKLITTKYVILLDEEDFFLPSGLEACINEIENSDIGSCSGRSLVCSKKNNSVNAYFPESPNICFDGYYLTDESAISRLKTHTYMYSYLCSTLNSVIKKEFFLNNIDSFKYAPPLVQRSSHFAFEMLSSFQSKSKVINSLTLIKSNDMSNIFEDYALQESIKIPLQYWLIDNFFTKERNSFIFNLVKNLKKINPHANLVLLEKEVKIALSLYCQSAVKYLNKPDISRYMYLLTKYSTKIRYLKYLYRPNIDKFLLKIKYLINKNLSIKTKEMPSIELGNGSDCIKDLCLKYNVKLNFEEIKLIENLILD